MAREIKEVAHLRTNKKVYDENYDHIFKKKPSLEDTEKEISKYMLPSKPDSLTISTRATMGGLLSYQTSAIEIKRADRGYEECMACGSTDDVYFLSLGVDNKTSVKLCNGCRGDTINLLKEITEAY